MRKSTIAAIAAAAVVGFGAVGSASADMAIEGFGDLGWDLYDSGLDTSEEEGHFRASGEIDVTQQTDGIMFRGDFDLNNCHNTSPAVDLPTGTDPTNGTADCGVGVDIEQLYVTVPVNDMISATGGIQNSKHGLEGQDATDINFASNGFLWGFVPSNVAGLSVTGDINEMFTVWAAYINEWLDLPALTDVANDWMAGASVTPTDGVGVNVSYLTDTTETVGDEFDINVTLSMIQDVVLAAEYLQADPGTGTGSLDNGYGVNAAYTMGDITLAGRYEAGTFEGTAPDVTAGSVAVSYALGPQTLVRADWSSASYDGAASQETGVLQLIHKFPSTNGAM